MDIVNVILIIVENFFKVVESIVVILIRINIGVIKKLVKGMEIGNVIKSISEENNEEIVPNVNKINVVRIVKVNIF